LKDIPSFSRLLTGSGAQCAYSIPQHLQNHVAAIETGAKRAQILYDPDQLDAVTACMALLRSRLIADQFEIPATSIACTSTVIRQLSDNSDLQFADTPGNAGSIHVESLARDTFEHWLRSAVAENATDIHVQVIHNIAEVKLRVDGALEPLRDNTGGIYPPGLAERAVAWAYNNASGKGSNSNSQFSAGENLYCMVAARDVLDKRIALRFQSVRGAAGMKAVCRLLHVDIDMPTLGYAQLGYAKSHIAQLESAAHTPAGFVIFAGVTGSGKTTTLKTFIETHPDNGRDAFYSIEDPVEYPLRGVHQIPIQRDLIDREGSAAKYAEVVAALMRADPGCVLMGEVRDTATARAGQQIVETGHMACATVHAHLLSGIVPRLTNTEIGMNRDVLTNPNMLTLLAYQALVPLLCPHCKLDGDSAIKHPAMMADARHIQSLLGTMEKRMRMERKLFYFRNPLGCEHCRQRGTKGLTVVAEILTPDTTWLHLIRQGEDHKAVMHFREQSDRRLHSADMTGKTIFEHTLHKAAQGWVDPRQCERFDSVQRFELL
jgi:type II secretory ATPase GspE/PulE/Tfp pilus assembly ATPase PilB-like protein